MSAFDPKQTLAGLRNRAIVRPMWAELAFYALAVTLLLGLLARAILTGRHGWGSHAVVRSVEPTKFRCYVCLNALVIALLAVQASIEATRSLPFSSLILGGLSGFHFVKALYTGEALDPAFSRSDEPGHYWLITAFLLALSAVFVGSFLGAVITDVA